MVMKGGERLTGLVRGILVMVLVSGCEVMGDRGKRAVVGMGDRGG